MQQTVNGRTVHCPLVHVHATLSFACAGKLLLAQAAPLYTLVTSSRLPVRLCRRFVKPLEPHTEKVSTSKQ